VDIVRHFNLGTPAPETKLRILIFGQPWPDPRVRFTRREVLTEKHLGEARAAGADAAKCPFTAARAAAAASAAASAPA